MNRKILLIGPQGSGKSTQAKLLSEFRSVPVISTGEIFRKLAEEDSSEGRRIKEILDEGRLVDDGVTAEIVKSRLEKPDCQGGFVLDGYPRSFEQIRLFDPKFDKVFYLKLSDESIMERLLKRGRVDDTPEAIKTRLNFYREQTQPLLDHYENVGILVEIDGEKSIDEVQSEIRSALS